MPLAYPDPPLADDLVLLRPWAESDLPLLERASADDYTAMIEHLPAPFAAEQGRAWIAAQHELLAGARGWALAIDELETGQAVGGVGIVFRHAPGVVELGIWVIEESRGCGVAERATRLLCAWALAGDTGIERIQATVEPWNRASQRVLEKVGFVREGLLRSYASWRGTRKDVLLYSLLPGDLTRA